ncbi:hypothetical protein [Methylomagnum sp.]
MVLLSTDSPEDLSANNDRLIAFSRELPGLPEETFLTHPNKWFVSSAHGCSCGLRHLCIESVELGFNKPVDWYSEDAEAIEATLKFTAIVRLLVQQGAQVECIDAWASETEPANLSGTIQVNLSEIADAEFRFFENHRFMFGLNAKN